MFTTFIEIILYGNLSIYVVIKLIKVIIIKSFNHETTYYIEYSENIYVYKTNFQTRVILGLRDIIQFLAQSLLISHEYILAKYSLMIFFSTVVANFSESYI